MRSKFQMTERDVKLATAGISPENIARELARFAVDERQKAIISGEASPTYDTYVNGRKGADESTVVPPGPILYEFSYWEPIIQFALAELNKRSPVKTGRYQGSHVVMIGSQVVSPSTQISSDEEVIIVNTQPYSRKIEVGHMRMSVQDGVYEDIRKKVQSQFGRAVKVRVKQILLPNGYVLKGRFTRGYKKFARTKLKKDTEAGARMTYPALIMTMA